jgi:arylformamidase
MDDQTRDAEHQYLGGQWRPGFPTLLAGFEKLGAEAVAASDCALDLRYGPRERETFDFFAAKGACRGTLLYFHAGYWHSRDKSGFRFLAPAFNASGLNVAFINYPLCPGVSLAELVQACRAAPAAVAAHAASRAAGPLASRLVVAGHSAGGHIAVELALDSAASAARARDAAAPPAAATIAAVAAFSGIYELAPLLTTSLNEKLRLDAESAAAASPLRRAAAQAAPALFAVGADETPAFIEQTRSMHAAWGAAGNRSRLEIVAGCDHFSLLQELATPTSALHRRVAGLADR